VVLAAASRLTAGKHQLQPDGTDRRRHSAAPWQCQWRAALQQPVAGRGLLDAGLQPVGVHAVAGAPGRLNAAGVIHLAASTTCYNAALPLLQ